MRFELTPEGKMKKVLHGRMSSKSKKTVICPEGSEKTQVWLSVKSV